MMHKDLFSDGIARIDSDAVERLLQIEQNLQAKKARQKRMRLLIIPAAALLALLVCMTAVIIPFIPRTLDIEYEPAKGLPENVWVYYVNDRGAQKRERVNLPGGAENVFAAWKHLNAVDDAVEILHYEEAADQQTDAAVVPDTLWEYLKQQISPASKTVTITLSPQITSCENYDALIDSLKETLAKYAGVTPEQVKILIDGEQTIIPPPSFSGISGNLKFSYTMQNATELTIPCFATGSTFELTVSMTNISDTDVIYHGSEMAFYPEAKLLTTSGDEVFELKPEEREITNEYAEHRLAPGETRTITYVFEIPEIALHGKYDLKISFGESKCFFPQVLIVTGASINVLATEFHEFLLKYGFMTTDPEAFKAAVGRLTYHSGQGMFDIMTPIPTDYAEGYDGEVYGSELFSYEYVRKPDGKCNNSFVGLVLPDDMRLPHGIAPGDRLVDSLHKMGIDAQTAQSIVERAQNLPEGEQFRLGDSASLYITRNSYGEYTVHHSSMTVLSSGLAPVYTFDVVYSQENMTFKCFVIKAGYSDFPIDAFTAPITVSPIDTFNVSKQLNDAETQLLLGILNVDNWQAGNAWQNSGLVVAFDYRITSAGKTYNYDSRIGIFIGNDVYLMISEQDRLAINEIFRVGNFGSISLVYTDYHVTLPSPIGQYVLHELNRNTWTHESLDTVPSLQFDCDGMVIGYLNNTFFTAGEHFSTSDSLTRAMMNGLESALGAMQYGTYDAILYYNGAFYGHSEDVDQRAQGQVSFSMNICPGRLDELLFAYSVTDASSTFGDIVDCKSSDYLITNNGQCFERFTQAFPDFAPAYDCQYLKMTFYKGNHCELDFSDEDAAQICEIFRTIDSFGSYIKPGTGGIAYIEFNRFPIAITTTGDIIMGDVVAQGNYDRELLLEILERCYNQSTQ